jgi:hypothetical protein
MSWRSFIETAYRAARRLVDLAVSSFTPVLFICALIFFGLRSFVRSGKIFHPEGNLFQVMMWAGPFLMSSVVLGFVVMGLVQLFKPEIRRAFHERAIARWGDFEGGLRHLNLLFRQELSHRGVIALFELPIEQLTAQIQAATDIALRSKHGDDLIFHILKGTDRDEYYRGSDDSPQRASRLSYLVQRRLDDLQIQVKHDWRNLLRTICLSLSFILASLIARVFGLWKQNHSSTAFIVVLLSLFSAFFSTIARDLVAVLERLRS